jgi:uncharacterized membrane protein YfcA
MDIGFIFSGFLVGLLVGLTGVGGGSLMTPILVLFFHIKPALAVGTDLLYASITKSVGIFTHGKLGNIDWKIVKRLMLGSIPASILTTYYLRQINIASTDAVDIIKFYLGIALLLTSVAVIFRPFLIKKTKIELFKSDSSIAFVTIFLGLILGGLVTLTSVGAGALGVTALLLIYPRIGITKIVGTDIAHAVPLTLVAGLGHASLGTVDYSLLTVLLIGSIPGIYIGSHLTAKVSEEYVRYVLALILIYVGQKLIFH